MNETGQLSISFLTEIKGVFFLVRLKVQKDGAISCERVLAFSCCSSFTRVPFAPQLLWIHTGQGQSSIFATKGHTWPITLLGKSLLITSLPITLQSSLSPRISTSRGPAGQAILQFQAILLGHSFECVHIYTFMLSGKITVVQKGMGKENTNEFYTYKQKCSASLIKRD